MDPAFVHYAMFYSSYVFDISANMSVVLCDKATKANRLLKDAARLRSLKTIVVLEGMSEVDTGLAKHVQVLSFDEALVGFHNILGMKIFCLLCIEL